ncbi:hydroxyisourate hydrolase [Paenibacillus alkalitolerans]|uniref:hydroxyisourate hydrolase n=1 Tax=Paenibacillus alkalitolerans TaxID=2799335 RepID=UPI0018F592E0|nr:hydroxyisourate hydrolase [Paenibacillus alkalitolerans]
MSGRLTTHVLDVSRGKPAEGMRVQLWRLDDGEASVLVAESLTNCDGRLDRPLLEQQTMEAGTYQLLFFAGDYFARCRHEAEPPAPFLDIVPVRFTISNPHEHYHVPLLAAPGGYSTYRGS